jgi:hypothetical protein
MRKVLVATVRRFWTLLKRQWPAWPFVFILWIFEDPLRGWRDALLQAMIARMNLEPLFALSAKLSPLGIVGTIALLVILCIFVHAYRLESRQQQPTPQRLFAQAYIEFSGGLPDLRHDENVSSITDDGTGRITISWARAFANPYYALSLTPKGCHAEVDTVRPGSVTVLTKDYSGRPTDPISLNVTAIGEPADD